MPSSSAIAGITSIAESIGADVASAALVVLLVGFRNVIFLRVGAAYRWLDSVFTRRRFVLVWIDDDRSYADRLIGRLRDHDQASRLNYHAIKRPRDLLFYPRSPKRVAGIVLLDTDVSKLADEPKTADRIEARLKAFIESGGGLIGSHDLIYRRARNEKLQAVFGCKLVDFESYQLVPYHLNQPNHSLAADLPGDFTLNDREVCWGKWSSDVAIVFTTKDKAQRPLVVCREYPKGRVVWLNSGDRGEQLCPSIAAPEEPFVLLLRNALRWVRETA
jgi:glycerophosphoryl diester phosphodiesterase